MPQSIVCMRAAMEGWMRSGYVKKSGPYESTVPCPICGDVNHPGSMGLDFVGETVVFVAKRDCGHTFGWYSPKSTIYEKDHWKSPVYELTPVTSMQDETLARIWADGYDGFLPNIYKEGNPWYQAYEQGREDRRRAE